PGARRHPPSFPTRRSSDLDAGDLPAELEAEEDRERDVGAIEHDLQAEPQPGLAAAEHVAEDGVVGEREGRGKDADADIGRHRLVDRKSTRLNSSHVKISYA